MLRKIKRNTPIVQLIKDFSNKKVARSLNRELRLRDDLNSLTGKTRKR